MATCSQREISLRILEYRASRLAAKGRKEDARIGQLEQDMTMLRESVGGGGGGGTPPCNATITGRVSICAGNGMGLLVTLTQGGVVVGGGVPAGFAFSVVSSVAGPLTATLTSTAYPSRFDSQSRGVTAVCGASTPVSPPIPTLGPAAGYACCVSAGAYVAAPWPTTLHLVEPGGNAVPLAYEPLKGIWRGCYLDAYGTAVVYDLYCPQGSHNPSVNPEAICGTLAVNKPTLIRWTRAGGCPGPFDPVSGAACASAAGSPPYPVPVALSFAMPAGTTTVGE